MYIIEEFNGEFYWLCGVFKSARKCKAFINKLPESDRHLYRTFEIPDQKYSLYIIENSLISEDGKEQVTLDYTDREELLRRIRAIVPSDNEKEVYFTYYIVDKDYRNPPKPFKKFPSVGGFLDYHHVDNFYLREIFQKNDGIQL